MWILLSLVPQKDEMDKNFSLLLNVARSLRYRTFEPIIGHELIVNRSDLIASESEALVGRFLDGCSFSSPEQGNLDGQIARYGLLDLRFQACARLLEKGYKTGIPLLKELNNPLHRIKRPSKGPWFACGVNIIGSKKPITNPILPIITPTLITHLERLFDTDTVFY